MGGFSDDRQLSQKLTHQLLSKCPAFSPTLIIVCTHCSLGKVLIRATPPEAGGSPQLGAPGMALPGLVQNRAKFSGAEGPGPRFPGHRSRHRAK